MFWSMEEIFWPTSKKLFKSTHNKIQKILKLKTSLANDYATVCLIDYPYLKKYELIAIDLSKQQKLDADPNATQ